MSQIFGFANIYKAYMACRKQKGKHQEEGSQVCHSALDAESDTVHSKEIW